MTEETLVHRHLLGVSQSGALRALKMSHPGATAFLANLLLDAARSHAHRIDIAWSAEEGILSVTDDGEGIHDFSRALTLFLMHRDREAHEAGCGGVGLYEAVFVSQQVEIHSLNRRVLLSESLLEAGSVPEYLAPDRRGTQVRLWLREQWHATVHQWETRIRDLAQGFPVPISFNGELQPRPDALNGSLSFRDTEVGELHVEGWESCEPVCLEDLPTCYSQGLPVQVAASPASWQDVLHLSASFPTTCSDRTVLYQPERVEKLIRETVRALWRRRLIERRLELTPQAFVEAHWRLCVRLNLSELLSDCPVSISMLSRYEQPHSAFQNGPAQRVPWPPAEPLSADALFVLDTFTRLRKARCGPPFHRAPLQSVYALMRRLPVLDRDVPPCHPAMRQAVDLADKDLRLQYALENPGVGARFEGHRVCLDIQTCRSYTIACDPMSSCDADRLRERLGSVRVTQWSFYDDERGLLVVPAGDPHPERALLQMEAYRESSEGTGASDNEPLRELVAGLRAGTPESYLAGLLGQLHPDAELLQNRRFLVRFDRNTRSWIVQPA